MKEVKARVDREKLAQLQADRALDRIAEQDRFMMEQVSVWSKWLTASLLAINSAGIIAVVSANGSEPGSIALPFFVLGVGSALIGGVAMQELYNNMHPVLRFVESYWLRVKLTGRRSRGLEHRMNRRSGSKDRWRMLPPAAGWVSGLLWLGGAIALLLDK